jgi:adenylate kinase
MTKILKKEENKISTMAYVFIGRSGCGKGTQAKLFIEQLKEKNNNEIIHIETGALLREFIKGNFVKEVLRKGDLVEEPIIIGLWSNYLINNFRGKENLVFDGCPRKLIEAISLDGMLTFVGIKKYKVIHINTSIKWSTERLLARGRKDDTKEAIAERMLWYDTEVIKSIIFFKDNKNCELIDVNGEQTIEQVHNELVKKVFKK